MSVLRGAAIAVAMGAAIVGVWRGTWAVGGSDSSCYALMAQAFATGHLQPVTTLANDAPWPDVSATFAPGGFIPSPVRADASAPVCAPGFSVLLAPLYVAGGADAIFLLTPLAGALLVYLTFVFGRTLGSEPVGLGAAILVAFNPVFVFQVVQPMNDVTVAALWMAVVVLAACHPERTLWIGAVTGLAILVRPNLAPAAIVIALWCSSRGWRSAMTFGAGALPAVIALVLLNTALYAHPLKSGYGAAGDLFSIAYVMTNVRNYGSALWQTQLALPSFGFAAILVLPRDKRRIVSLSTLVAGAIISVYLFYRPLPEWWYLRFWLPALPVLTVLALATLVHVTRRQWIVIPVVLLVGGFAVRTPAMGDALNLAHLEKRFRTAAAVVKERLPEHAVYLTVWESGSLRYHAERDALVWDSLAPTSLDTALDWLNARGREPYIVIEDWEEPIFRARFAADSLIGQLDWPPRFDIERRVKIYRPADRSAYLRGDTIPTEFVWANRP